MVFDRLGLARPAGPRAPARRAHLRRQGAGARARCRRRRSTRCSWTAPGGARPSSGSRAATRSCSGAAARRRSPARGPASRARSCPASRARSRRPRSPGSPSRTADVARSFAVVTGSTAHGDGVDLAALGHRHRHARGADGRREARRDLRGADRGRAVRRRARRDRPVGGDPRAAFGGGHARRPARRSPRPSRSDRRPRWSWAPWRRSPPSWHPRIDRSRPTPPRR